VDESRMIRTQMGSTIDQKVVAVAWGALYDTTPVTVTCRYVFSHLFIISYM
jgi:hypothetical protein